MHVLDWHLGMILHRKDGTYVPCHRPLQFLTLHNALHGDHRKSRGPEAGFSITRSKVIDMSS
jgi:hypothetical protein